ncbi:hypothetical protein L1785_19710 [Antribacter sp. KLBMP9083]|uniref:Uncharacterized protein n=1 Tax=Antribacter soli TaxID=2910976 RepID=A0AA41QI67_9MICO|nr:hypothetical protein [Antribacter soli]MCF4123200.1 hypothetical protein [Antribacter soli]
MPRIRWSSLLTVLGGGAVALAGLAGALTGHPWSWLPVALGLGIAVREVRFLQRARAGRILGNSQHQGRKARKDSSPNGPRAR